MPPEMLRWRALGRRLKRWRLRVANRGLRQEAERRGLLASELLHMENGYREPLLSAEMLLEW
jgi:hypothetical protein